MCDCKEENLDRIIDKYRGDKSNLIRVLNDAQEIYGYLPEEVQKKISIGLGIPMSEIYGVITFYSRFTTEPKGKYQISVCLGTACYVKESEKILNRIKTKLNLEEGKCTEDGKFSLTVTRCIGACGAAPVFTINDEVYGKATLEKVDNVLNEYMSKE